MDKIATIQTSHNKEAKAKAKDNSPHLRHLAIMTGFIFLNHLLAAQFGVARTLQEQFHNYSSQAFQEKIFAHTDKSVYMTGEIIWFKLYQVEGSTLRPSDLSRLVYVEILNKEKRPMMQSKINIQNGSGDGSFMIPTSFNSGNYILRAYTNWMKNFSPDYFFEKVITIINPLKNSGPERSGAIPVYDIQFFPEGGNLVEGLKSKIAFRVVDQNGIGLHSKGLLLNQNNDTITKFETLKFGMGSFSFTPLKGDSYRGLIQLQNNTATKDLPKAYENGYVMDLKFIDNDRMKITVKAGGNSNESIYLFGHTRQVEKVIEMQEMKAGVAEFIVNKTQFAPGISQLTIFNRFGTPVCERLFFLRPTQKFKPGLKADRENYSTREKAILQFTSMDQNGQNVSGDFSLSVFRIDSLQLNEETDIASYLWLRSELKGSIESPGYYLNDTTREADEALDHLMLTQGWRRFKWEDLLQRPNSGDSSSTNFKFLPEYEGHIIKGTVINKRTGNVAREIPTYLSIPAERFYFGTSTSDANGEVKFIVRNFYGPDEIVVQTNPMQDSIYRIDISNPFSEKFSSTAIPAFRISEDLKNDLVVHSISSQVQNSFRMEKLQQFSVPGAGDTTAFYGKPDKKYFLDDYTRFVTMEEVMREYVMEVRVRKHNEKFNFQVLNTPFKTMFDRQPLVLLDGVPVFDINKIIEFDPLKIKLLEVVARKYFIGPLVTEGIVSYGTYEGNLAGFELNPNAIVLEYEGSQISREFFSPVYEVGGAIGNRIPDYRNVLLWSPDIKTDNQGKKEISFYTSDLPGKYAAVVQGITANGLPGSAVITFLVNK